MGLRSQSHGQMYMGEVNSSCDPADWYEKTEAFCRLRLAFLKATSYLSEREMTALHYRYREDLPLKEVAKLLSTTPQCAGRLIKSALRKIKQGPEGQVLQALSAEASWFGHGP